MEVVAWEHACAQGPSLSAMPPKLVLTSHLHPRLLRALGTWAKGGPARSVYCRTNLLSLASVGALFLQITTSYYFGLCVKLGFLFSLAQPRF